MSEALTVLQELCAVRNLQSALALAERKAMNFVDGVPLPIVADNLRQRTAAAWSAADNYVARERARLASVAAEQSEQLAAQA